MLMLKAATGLRYLALLLPTGESKLVESFHQFDGNHPSHGIEAEEKNGTKLKQ